ncbi:AEC family transporter [Sphingomonas oligophenolica]|uniref:AEC family transporter n=1 Tax=Sphingomonas oligophenolica TaxID=301154 RepID=A0A502CJB5_9SPHN|nr:AEC family transporter [Sphingomonas oligophenolica]TPG13745.1 AEC family transporter [Sphingomonas oligophenolica]
MTVVGAVLPVFAIILVGFAFARLRGLGEDAVAILNAYVVWVALPALLFDFVAQADRDTLAQPGFILVFGAAMLAVFAVALIANRHRPLARRSLDALSASYANTAYLGIPLAGALLGPVGTAAAVIASLMTVCALFALSVTLVEIDLAPGGKPLHRIGRIATAVVRNPLVAAPLAGLAWAATGLAIPAPAASVLALLSATASPVALVTIGVFLAQPRPAGNARELGATVMLKLIAQPLLTFAMLLAVPLARPWAAAALLLAALPTGTGPFMVAQLYQQDVTLTARTILVSTILSVLTVTALAWVLVG